MENGTDPNVTPTEPQTQDAMPEVQIPENLIQKAIDKRIDELVTAEINKRLAGITPQKNITDSTAVEMAKFQKMSYKERVQLFNSNPEMYKKLTIGACN